VLNQRTGSRTIIHYRHLPEFGFSDFEQIELLDFDWLHFEGRNVVETARMLARVRQVCPTLPISLEVEKTRPHIENLFNKINVLLFSKIFSQHYTKTDNATLFLQQVQKLAPYARLVCAWGAKGGYALETDGSILYNPAHPPPKIVDTLGAGDTFNAGIIDSLCRGQDLAMALNHACGLAGKKCGEVGLEMGNT
jgi:ketohexokinase